MNHHLTESIEDYLKAVYIIGKGESRVTTNSLASHLKVKPASVTGMLKKLAERQPPLVDYKSHKGVLLTDEGLRMALETIRHHRLLETFLVEILGFEREEVHEEAEKLEHFISEKLENRIEELLGFPSFDPHGDPIPDRNLNLPDTSQTRLAEIEAGKPMIVRRVSHHDPDLMNFLKENNLVPGSRIEIRAYAPIDENHTIQIGQNKNEIVLGKKITRHIYVEEMDTERNNE